MVDDAGSVLLNFTNYLCSVFAVIRGLGGSEVPGNCSELVETVTSPEGSALSSDDQAPSSTRMPSDTEETFQPLLRIPLLLYSSQTTTLFCILFCLLVLYFHTN